jgi:hypothetical protein
MNEHRTSLIEILPKVQTKPLPVSKSLTVDDTLKGRLHGAQFEKHPTG